jgi:hypothetical protein
MPNPKDLFVDIMLNDPEFGKYMEKTIWDSLPEAHKEAFQKAFLQAYHRECVPNSTPTHFPGCHKVHIECANNLVEYAARIFIADIASGSKSGDILLWLKTWKTPE